MTGSNRGFASMDKEKQKEIAAKGGRSTHAPGKAHVFDSKEAAEAGRKGSKNLRNKLGEEGYLAHLATIGARGGENHAQNKKK